jgi:hypothetical protein
VSGRLTLTSRRAEALFRYDLVAKPGVNVTVQGVVALVEQNGRHHYRYDGNGSGCLYWSTQLVSDFMSAGLLDGSEMEGFMHWITEIRRENEFWVPNDQGTFIT